MQKNILANRLCRWLAVAAFGLLATTGAHAQLAGPKSVPGTYATLAAAIADLNTQGVGTGGVTFNIAAGYTETFASPTAGAITATGTAANPIVFQKSGTGANPKITAGVGTSTNLDAIISLAGSDFVTLDGLELAENAANTTTTTQMEFGIALFRPSPTDGCQNNTIRNCVVTLTKTNTATFAIYGAASTAVASTSVAATSPAGAHSGNKVDGNILTNAASGMYFTASTSTTLANYDQNNEVGVTAANRVYNFGTTATGWGIGGNYQNGFKVVNNIVNNTLDYAAGTTSPVAASTVTSTLRGIYGNSGPSASIDIVGNTVTLASGATTSLLTGIDNGIGSTSASNTVNITGNTVQLTYATSTTGAMIGIVNSSSATTVNITGNTVQNTSAPAATTATFIGITSSAGAAINLNGNTVSNNVVAGTGTMTLISSSLVSAAAPVSISNNTLTGNSKMPNGTTSSVSLLCLTLGSATTTITGNTITNNTIVTAGTSTSAATLVGINSTASSTPSENLSNNIITGLTISGTSTATTNILRGILTAANGTGDVQTLNQNTVGNLAIASGSGTVTGISVPTGGGPGSAITRNKVYDLSAIGANGSVTGLLISAGGTYAVSNNLIGDLRAPASASLVAVSGFTVAGSTAVNAYFNTIYLNASSTGATFGTSGIYLGSTSTTLDLRNNLVVNTSVPAGAGGVTTALRRISGTAGTAPSNLSGFTNNNLYYAGTPSATNLIYVEGTTATQTNPQQTLAAYKAFLLTREGGSVTEPNTPFASTTGTSPNFLHLTPGAPTQAESAGQPISGLTIDYDGDTRNANSPDIGADEGSFLLVDQTGPTITITALGGSAGSTVSRTLAVTITDVSGVATGANAPRLYFRKGTSGAFVVAAPPTVAGSTYTFTFDYSLVGGVAAGDAINYYVAAQDALGNLSTNPFGGAGVSPPGTTPPAAIYTFSIQATLSGVYYVSATSATSPVPARTYATLTAAVSAYNNSALGGAVTFLLLDPTYSTAETFPIAVLNNPDASATNTLTIKPSSATGTTAFAITGSHATAILQLLASDYVTIDGSLDNTLSATDLRPSRDLTVSNTNTGTSSYVIQQFAQFTNDGATFNTIKNLVAVGTSTATVTGTLYGIGLVGTNNATTANQYTNNTVQNCAVRSTQVGIASLGGTIALKNQNATITQNDLNAAVGAGALTRAGILSSFDNSVQITQNTIDNIVFTGSADVVGISLGFGLSYGNSTSTGSETTNATVTRNTIGTVRQTNTYSAIGIGAATATTGTNTIANNLISGVLSNGTGADFTAGIYVNGSTGGGTTRVLYNSVSMTGTLTGASQSTFALAIGGSTPTVELRNNVLYNSQSNGSSSYAIGFAYSSTTGSYVGLTSTNNAFFGVTGTGLTGSLGSSGTVRATLADLNAETGQDRPTTATGPVGTSVALTGSPFVSDTDLHVLATSPSGLALNGAAMPLADVTVDFDNETRSTTRPDIGGDEFVANLDVAAVALVSPVPGNSCFGSTEAVTVSIRNASTMALDFAATPVTVTVTITPPGTGATPVTFTTTVNTGTLAANATQNVTLTGTADLSAPGAYAVTVTTSLTGDDDIANNTLTPVLTITNAPRVATFTYAGATGTICAGSTTTLTPTLGAGATAGTFSSTTGLSINATTGVINPATSTGGTYVVTNTLPAANGCPVTTATQSITITPASTSTFTYSGAPFCVSSTTTSTPTVTGTSGGTFSSTAGLTLNATTGAITLSSSTPGTYTVTYSVGGTCPSSSTQSVTITAAPVATFSYGTTTSYCVSGTTNPTVTLGAGATAGTFSSTAGLTLNATTGAITLSSSTPGTYTVTNSVAAASGCAAATATTTVTITAAPVAAFSYPTASICAGQTATVTPTLGTGATAGTFSSTTGLSINATTGVISPSTSTAGTYTVTNTVAASGGCAAATSTATVTILPVAVATFSYGTTTSYCVSGTTNPTVALGAGATAGTFSSTAGLTLNATTGAITLSSSTPGTYTVTNTVATSGSACGSTATSTVTITAAPVATFSYPTASICAGQTATVTPTLGTGATAGTFSSTTGLTINATTGVINPATSTGGTYTVTNTVAASSGCAAATSTATVTINALPATPTVTVSYPTGSTALLTSSTVPAGTTYQWFLNGVAISGATGQTYTANGTTAPGSYTVRLSFTATGCQSAPSTITTVTAATQALAGTSLRLFPNPTTDGQVTLQLSGYSKTVQLTVLDALGRVVLTQKVAAGQPQAQLDLSGVASGVYLLRATTEGGTDVLRIVRQ